MEKNSNFTIYYVTAGQSISQTNLTTRFVTVPLLTKYRLTHLITLHAGPEISRLTYASENLLKDSDPAFKKTAAGVVGGAELAFAPSFSLFGSYYYNLSNVNNIDNRYQWHYSQLRFGIKVGVF